MLSTATTMRSLGRGKDDDLRCHEVYNHSDEDEDRPISTSRDRRMKRLLMANNQENVAQKGNADGDVDSMNDAVLDEVFEDLQQAATNKNSTRPRESHSDHDEIIARNAAANDNKVMEAIEEAFGRGADLYSTVLKVPRDSYEEKLRKAYFYRSLEFHAESQPADAKAEDLSKIAKKYRAVCLVYKILRNDECRRLYDEHGIITLQSHKYASMEGGMKFNEEINEKSPRDLRKELLGEKAKEDGASPVEQQCMFFVMLLFSVYSEYSMHSVHSHHETQNDSLQKYFPLWKMYDTM